MKKLEISPSVQRIIASLGGHEWLRVNAQPWSMGYDRSQFFFSPRRGITYRIKAGGKVGKLATVKVEEFQGMKGCVVVGRFRCEIDRLREAIEASIVA